MGRSLLNLHEADDSVEQQAVDRAALVSREVIGNLLKPTCARQVAPSSRCRRRPHAVADKSDVLEVCRVDRMKDQWVWSCGTL